jgi:hexosaminidase
MKKILIFATTFFYLQTSAQNTVNIVPVPVNIKEGKGSFNVNSKTLIVAIKADEKKTAAELNKYLVAMGASALKIVSTKANKDAIEVSIKPDKFKTEGYRIAVDANRVFITGNDKAGLFYGLQTFFQLLPVPDKATGLKKYPLSVPSLSITDYPRFPYRGMHFDVARHFSSVESVKKYIDYLAMYKFNTFHWHLTDDQGWRIEIKKYPLLTQIGSCREQTLVGPYGTNKYDGKKYCGFYTQEEIKEVIRYATERHINIIPEIEMPGHALAALASYSYLGCTKGPYKAAETWGVFDDVFCAGNDSTFTFLQNVLDEVMALFPSGLIHIGGDESPKTRWKTCADCQKRIAAQQLKDEHELQSYFITRIEKYINSKGRNIIGWDEILEGGLAPNATVMSWRGEEGGITAAQQHHNVVMTPGNYLYFDHSQSNNEDSVTFGGYNSLEKVYSYEPVPAVLSAEEGKYILGAQANLWTEYITNSKKVEYQLFPRIAALSEVLWSPKEKRNREDFERRLPVVFDRLDQQKINYSKAYYEPLIKFSPAADNNGLNISVHSKQKKSKFYFGNKSLSQFSLYSDSINTVIDRSGLYGIRMLGKMNGEKEGEKEGEKWGVAQTTAFNYLFASDINVFFNKATGKKISLSTLPSSSYPGGGAFTLVDGIQNNTGMSKSSQFLGFSGDHLDATIDLGVSQPINEITLHVFEQTASWIYRPASVNFYASQNGEVYELLQTVNNTEAGRHLLYQFSKPISARYIKIFAKNAGIIPDGNPGAGNKAWLFADEIEVN